MSSERARAEDPTMTQPFRRLLATALVAVVAAATWAGATGVARPDPTPTTPASSSDCPAVAGIFVPGTWETDQSADPARARGLLAPVATSLESEFGNRFEAVFPAYAARAMDGMSYGDSQAGGVAAARAALSEIAARCRATKFLLSGYSQGADAAGDLATAIGCHSDPVPPSRIVAVGLVADPKQGTSGGKLVGPPVTGTGIRGTRTEGFCALAAVTAQLCETGDRYCATDAATNPVLAGLGKVLTQPTTTTSTTGTGTGTTATSSTPTPTAATGRGEANSGQSPATGQLTGALDAGLSRQDLTRLPSDLDTVIDGIRSGRPRDPGLTQIAASLRTLLARLGDLGDWVAANPTAQQRLSNAPDGSPEQQASRVLQGAQHGDLDTALDALSTITDALASGRSRNDTSLLGALDTLASATAGLSATGTDALAQAGSVLSILKPSTLITQVTTVASDTLEFAANTGDLVGVVGRIGAAVTDPATDLAGKVHALHEIFGQLNRLCQPVVRLGAGIDLSMVSGLLGLIPDPGGIAQTAALVVSVLSHLDVIGLARQIGALQENLWHILETLTGGGDLLAIGAAFAELVPTVLGFASLALDTLTGSATKTDPGLLDTALNPTGASDLSGLAAALTSSATSQGADAAAQLAGEGLDAASFYTSGAHQSYDSYVVDAAGRTALGWLADWFANRIRQVGA